MVAVVLRAMGWMIMEGGGAGGEGEGRGRGKERLEKKEGRMKEDQRTNSKFIGELAPLFSR